MPTALYNRYIPPKAVSKPIPAIAEPQAATHESKKRKRGDHGSKEYQKHKKRGADRASSSVEQESDDREPKGTSTTSLNGESRHQSTTNGLAHEEEETHGPQAAQHDSSQRQEETGNPTVASNGSVDKPERSSKKKKRGEDRDEEQHADGKNGMDVAAPTKHAALLSKYEKAAKPKSSVVPVPEDVAEDEEVPSVIEEPVLHDLVPIPLPKREAQGPAFAASSALPQWLSQYTSVKKDASSSFNDLQIHPDLLKRLQRKGFGQALPVQSAVLPLLLPVETQHPGDLCVSAVTGSGKTLAYCLPIVQDLIKRDKKLLRAVIVVPTRELVNQVYEVLDMCAEGQGLRIGVATGSQRIDQEQAALVGERPRFDIDTAFGFPDRPGRTLDSSTHDNASDDEDDEDFDRLLDVEEQLRPQIELPPNHVREQYSKIDVLITTPGRLVDHIKRTKGFKLQDLEWLVIDEADRLLDASFQEWVETVNTALVVPKQKQFDPYIAGLLASRPVSRPKKIMLSATMTRDLQKLASLKLHNPKLVVVEGAQSLAGDAQLETPTDGGSLSLPSKLTEYGVPVGDGSDKPLCLLALLRTITGNQAQGLKQAMRKTDGNKHTSRGHDDDDVSSEVDESDASSVLSESTTSSSSHEVRLDSEPVKEKTGNALIFTSSTESANRLSRLLVHLQSEYAALTSTLTKSATSSSTAKAIARFQSGKLRILISTDRVARGLDLTNLTNVINYDIPHSVTSYVHRVGRTARAERTGTAWTLLEDKQARWFWKTIAPAKEIRRSDLNGVRRFRLDLDGLGSDARQQYADALRELEQDVNKGSRHG